MLNYKIPMSTLIVPGNPNTDSSSKGVLPGVAEKEYRDLVPLK